MGSYRPIGMIIVLAVSVCRTVHPGYRCHRLGHCRPKDSFDSPSPPDDRSRRHRAPHSPAAVDTGGDRF
uniref:Putative secreted protein n=1 Tax=Anopheles marajoara TaxID=58244 RepID=A0A2M4CF06_9DIPT